MAQHGRAATNRCEENKILYVCITEACPLNQLRLRRPERHADRARARRRL